MATKLTPSSESFELARHVVDRIESDAGHYGIVYIIAAAIDAANRVKVNEVKDALKEARDYISLDTMPSGDIHHEAKMIIKQINEALARIQ